MTPSPDVRGSEYSSDPPSLLSDKPAVEKQSVRWALLIEYDGTDYVGWQRQTNGISIQQRLEEALERLLGHPVRVHGAGRTDAGVHALGQVAAFTTSRDFPPETVVRGTNAHLDAAIRVRDARCVAAEFDPRRDARLRHYRYHLLRGRSAPALGRREMAWTHARMDWERAREALDRLSGCHDFAAFRSRLCTARRTVLNLERAELTTFSRGTAEPLPFSRAAEEDAVVACFDFECRSFLHHMVRYLVAIAVEIGKGRVSLDQLDACLAAGDRGGFQLAPAPPEGLCLLSVAYPRRWGLWESTE
jgi:tRNA pseudouridine38-40 synthase